MGKKKISIILCKMGFHRPRRWMLFLNDKSEKWYCHCTRCGKPFMDRVK